jgi:hypothetical protein
MVLEILGLVVGIVGIILSGVEIYSKLWKKIKHIFGSSMSSFPSDARPD